VEGASEFDLLAASLRADARDTGAFVEALAAKLEASFPDAVEVDRKGGLFGAKKVRKLAIRMGDRHYELEAGERLPRTRRRTVVRGIALKSEDLGLEEWIDALARDLVEEAGRGERGRIALERLLT
jgi:hypothetical protein